MKVTDAVFYRASKRAFRNSPVSNDLVRKILECARRAPSGGNLQPWHVHVATGKKRRALIREVQQQFDITPEGDPIDHDPYPASLGDPYSGRRREVGRQLYDLVEVPRTDRAGKLKYLRRNFEFFGAPVGLMFTIGREMEPLQWVDLGIFIQTIILLAADNGLASCCQGAWSLFSPAIRETLDIPDHHIVACGMALGFADESARINSLHSQRAGLDEIATFYE